MSSRQRVDGRECRVQARAFLILAAEHRDALAIFAQTREHISVIGLRLVLILGHDDEAARDANHRSAGQQRVEKSGDHQKSRDAKRRAAHRDRELAADEPEHADESDRRDDGREDADCKLDRSVDTQAQILSHAMFRIAVIARNQVELIITAARKPLIQHVRIQPFAPSALQRRLCIGGRCRDAHTREDQGKKDHRLVQHLAAVALVERVEHGAVPYVQPVLKTEIDKRNRDYRERQ
jgi:hypothetical protein